MDRRLFTKGLVFAGGTAAIPAVAFADPVDEILSQLASDPSLVESSWALRESTTSRGVPKGRASSRKLPTRVSDFITRFEVASRDAYITRYSHPIWPKGNSGVTIGIGYDLKFANKEALDRDWPMLTEQARVELSRVAGIGGVRAQQARVRVRDIEIPWSYAERQFLRFLPYPTAQTEAAFPNTGALSDLSFGALVSLVYNRGPGMPRHSKRRREMREIHRLLSEGRYPLIPAQFRAMKSLWPGRDARGLVLRREAEARLFELGLRTA